MQVCSALIKWGLFFRNSISALVFLNLNNLFKIRVRGHFWRFQHIWLTPVLPLKTELLNWLPLATQNAASLDWFVAFLRIFVKDLKIPTWWEKCTSGITQRFFILLASQMATWLYTTNEWQNKTGPYITSITTKLSGWLGGNKWINQ